MDIIKQEYEDYWNVSEVEREICREKLRQQLPMLRGAVGASQVDIANAIGNKLIESTVSGTDIDAKFEELKNELIGLIG